MERFVLTAVLQSVLTAVLIFVHQSVLFAVLIAVLTYNEINPPIMEVIIDKESQFLPKELWKN